MSNPFKRSNIQIERGVKNADSPTWDGTGKHPILGLTREEIIALNEQISDAHAGNHVDSKEKKAQPTEVEAMTLAQTDAQQKQAQFIDNMADQLSSRKA